MMTDSTRDVLHSPVALAEQLLFRPERSGGRDCYVIEDRQQNRFFRIGLAEYTFISLLDADTSPAEAVSLTARTVGPNALSEEQATSILHWLRENGLASSTDSTTSTSGAGQDRVARKQLERFNPFWMKIPLANPNRLVGQLTRVFHWFYSWPAVCCVAVLLVTAGLVLAGHWAEFHNSSRQIFDSGNWLWLAGVWLILKVIHEASHAVACRRLGAAVPETGVIFILLAPLAYVDVTTSLRFRSNWQRIQIAAAGMYVEITLGALALVLWTFTSAELPRYILHNIVIMATLTTLLFNANPLMRFDGYYILSDILGIPNLYSSGNAAVKRITRRVLTGKAGSEPADTGMTAFLILLYGILALLWRILVCASLLIAASVLFHGLGVILTVLGIFLWVARPLLHSAVAAWHLMQFQPAAFIRSCVVCGSVCGVVAVLLLVVPSPDSRVAPGVVDYQDSAIVRADGPGFIRTIHVVDGQQVKAGDVLIECENLQLEVEVSDLAAAMRQSQLRYNKTLREHNPAAAQVEAENRATLEKRLTEKRSQLEALTLRAPVSGRVMSRQLRWKLDIFVHDGDELLAIGPHSGFEFRASVSESDARSLAAGDTVNIRLRGVSTTGQITNISPKSTRRPTHYSLIAPYGGPLPVIAANNDSSDREDFELLKPRIEVKCSLGEQRSDSLRSGSTGAVHLTSLAPVPIGRSLYRLTSEYIQAALTSSR